MADFRRYAVFFAPRPSSPLGRFGAAWFGWDAERGVDCAGLELKGLPRPSAELVAVPRKYGFHGTLTAPFRLGDGVAFEELDGRARDVVSRFPAFEVPMKTSALGPFLALTPAVERFELRTLAKVCVMGFNPLRAPLSPDEIERRQAGGLTRRQEAHLMAWGYPYVLDDFEFHLTLTGPLSPEDQAATLRVLEPALAPILAAPIAFEDLCLFGEAADGRFHVVRRHALWAAAEPP